MTEVTRPLLEITNDHILRVFVGAILKKVGLNDIALTVEEIAAADRVIVERDEATCSYYFRLPII